MPEAWHLAAPVAVYPYQVDQVVLVPAATSDLPVVLEEVASVCKVAPQLVAVMCLYVVAPEVAYPFVAVLVEETCCLRAAVAL